MTQTIVNLGTGGAALNGQNGSTSGADSNDALFLDWPGDNAGNYVYLPGVSGNYLSVPDEAALDITGDIDIRVQVAMDDWTPAATQTFLSKRTAASSEFSFSFFLQTSGKIVLVHSANGSTAVNTAAQVQASVAVDFFDDSVKWVRATLDVDNGSSQHEISYFSSDDGSTWTQIGTTIVRSGTTSIYSSTANVEVGSQALGTTSMTGKIYRAQVLDGIDGTTVLNVDCSRITSGSATSFTATTGQTVSVNRSTSGRKSVAVVSPCWLFGTDDYMEVADNDLIDFGASDSFTVLAVVRQWATQGTSGKHVVGKNTQVAVSMSGYALWQNSDTNGPSFYFGDGASRSITSAPASVPSGSLWVSSAVRDALITRSNYLNSVAVSGSDTAVTGSLSNASVFRIGRPPFSVGFNADMEVIAIAVFRRDLTATEITAITDYYQARLS